MAQEWYIEAGGRVDGPVSTPDLRARAADGRLAPTDRVSTDRVKWVPAEKVKGLVFSPFAPTLVVPPPATIPKTVIAPPAVGAAAGPTGSMLETITSPVPLEQIPGYQVEAVLGRGACGIVFRARQLKLGRVVALKAILLTGSSHRTAVARFEHEAVALAKLQHPNIVAVYDSGHFADRVFFAMELLDGEDLGKRLDRGVLDEPTAWGIARQTAAALAHAAAAGVFHRDVKPANLFLVQPPTGFLLPPGVPMVKVTDFGLALTTQPGEAEQRLTAAGTVVGTPVYMAPEQFASSSIDHRADIYSLGATVFHALNGDIPFDGGSIWEVMQKKVGPAPKPGPHVSPESAELLAAMMAERPEDRIGSYADLIARIDRLPGMAWVASSPSAVPVARSRRKWPVVTAGLVGGVALAGVVAWAAGAFKPKPTDPPPKSVNPGTGNPATATFVPGNSELLFNGETMDGWSPLGGPPWTIEKDDEKTPALTGIATIRRPFRAPPNFRVVLGLDLHKAKAAEILVATADGPPEKAARWSLRVSRDGGAVFGKRDGDGQSFQPLGPAVPFPMPEEREGLRPYLEVRTQRAGGKIEVRFSNRVVGTLDDDGRLKVNEVRVTAEGGPVRIDTAEVVELTEKK